VCLNAADPGRRGFSLIELVMVVAVIGLIGAIAIPRLSRGSQGASESALAQDLKQLRQALEHYAVEHGGVYPVPDDIAHQLTRYTDLQGNTSGKKTARFIYGPYLRSIPPLPVGSNRGSTTIALPGNTAAGWIYVPAMGTILPNISRTDVSGQTLTGLGFTPAELEILKGG